jgi:hypothetical protein
MPEKSLKMSGHQMREMRERLERSEQATARTRIFARPDHFAHLAHADEADPDTTSGVLPFQNPDKAPLATIRLPDLI